MLRTTKSMKEKYEKIQNYIFTLIPEKWEEIYLYASVYANSENKQSGELFFYYLPKGILKKKPINVYEVPKRFNINEEQYLKIVEELYKCIKSLKQDFADTEQDMWTNLTISIADFKFKVEYNYDILLPSNDEEIFERNVVWKYNYLKIGGDTKEERKILEEYFSRPQPTKKEVYETGLYIKTENNKIDFDKDDAGAREFVIYEKDEILSKAENIKNKFFGNKSANGDGEKWHANRDRHLGNKDVKKKSEVKQEESNNKEEKKSKNQILDN